MDMDSAAVFLAGSILYALGLIVILVATVFANNVIHKYWKSFGWKFFTAWHFPERRFIAEEHVKSEPILEPKNTDK